jgi:hypothetical protein
MGTTVDNLITISSLLVKRIKPDAPKSKHEKDVSGKGDRFIF